MKSLSHRKSEEVDEVVSAFLIFFVAMFATVAALNFVSIWLLLALYGAFVTCMWIGAYVVDHRDELFHSGSRSSETDLDALLKEIRTAGPARPSASQPGLGFDPKSRLRFRYGASRQRGNTTRN